MSSGDRSVKILERRPRSRQGNREPGPFLDCIPKILRHQSQQKIWCEVRRRHPVGDGFEQRTPSCATHQHVQGLGTVESAALDHSHCFRKRCDLYSTQEIVDELEQRAAPRWPHINDCSAHRSQDGTHLFQRTSIASDKKCELTCGRVRLRARHWSIEELTAALRCGNRELSDPANGDCPTFDTYGLSPGCRQRALLAEPHAARGNVIGNHADDDGGGLRSHSRGAGDLRAVGNERLGLIGVAIEDSDRVSVREQSPRHPRTHDTEAQKGDVRLGHVHQRIDCTVIGVYLPRMTCKVLRSLRPKPVNSTDMMSPSASCTPSPKLMLCAPK